MLRRFSRPGCARVLECPCMPRIFTASFMCALLLTALPRPALARAIVTLTFDDTLAEHEEAARLLEEHGLHGTFFVNSPRLGQRGYLQLHALQSLQAAGHEIGGHTVHHPRLASLDPGEMERQICDDRANLLLAGFDVQSFAYPFGLANSGVQAAAASCGYNSARGVGGLSGPEIRGESTPPANPLYLRTLGSLQCDTNVFAIIDSLQRAALANETTWFILVLHHLMPTCEEPYTLSWGAFVQLLDWLEDEAGEELQVRTLQQVLGGATQPAVRGRPAPVRSTHGNLLLNASLETYSDPSRLSPDCWQQAGWGDNEYAWLRDANAARGAYAQTVTITRHATGARRLVTAQDLGACAPRALPGQAYLLTSWYRSSAPVYWMIYYRDARSTWHPWAVSPVFSPSERFAYRMWRTPPIPAEAEALSVGLSIASPGSLTVDDVSLLRWDEVPTSVQATYELGISQLPQTPPS